MCCHFQFGLRFFIREAAASLSAVCFLQIILMDLGFILHKTIVLNTNCLGIQIILEQVHMLFTDMYPIVKF